MDRGSGLPAACERFGQIQLRIFLRWIDVDGFLPILHCFIGMAQAYREQSGVHQRVGVPRKAREHLLIVRVGFVVAACFDQHARAPFLRDGIGRIHFFSACRRSERFVAMPRLRGDTRDAHLE